MTALSIAPVDPARSILAYDRRTGAAVELVPSCSKPGSYHLVTTNGCDCAAFKYRRTCRHLAPPARPLADGSTAHLQVKRASGEWPAAPAESELARRTRLAAEYHSIFGTDGDA